MNKIEHDLLLLEIVHPTLPVFSDTEFTLSTRTNLTLLPASRAV